MVKQWIKKRNMCIAMNESLIYSNRYYIDKNFAGIIRFIFKIIKYEDLGVIEWHLYVSIVINCTNIQLFILKYTSIGEYIDFFIINHKKLIYELICIIKTSINKNLNLYKRRKFNPNFLILYSVNDVIVHCEIKNCQIYIKTEPYK